MVGREPGGAQLGLAQRLGLPFRESRDVAREPVRVGRLEVERPCPHDRLQKIEPIVRRDLRGQGAHPFQPPPGLLLPHVRDRAQHREPGADVLSALVVVGGGRRHRARPMRGAGGGPCVEVRDRRREALGVEAHVVAREQPAVAVEGGVFDRFRGHGRAQLLEAPHRRPPRFGRPGPAAGEPLEHEIDSFGLARLRERARTRARALEDPPVRRRCSSPSSAP